jgi:hypothetical protein
MEFTYAEFAVLNHYLNTQADLPVEIAKLNAKLNAYFAAPTRDVPAEMWPKDDPTGEETNDGPKGSIVSDPVDDGDERGDLTGSNQ